MKISIVASRQEDINWMTYFSQLPKRIQRTVSNKINNISTTLPTIKDMFTTLRYDF